MSAPGKSSKTRGNSRNTAEDYRRYRMTIPEILRCLLVVSLLDILLSVVFYDSLLPALFLLIPFSAAGLRYDRRRRQTRREERMRADFNQAVKVFGDYLRSGYSVQKAVTGSARELSGLLGEYSEILKEWQGMARMMQNGQTAEAVFADFGERSGIAEIRDFAAMLAIALRSGGALHEVVDAASRNLSLQESVRAEIRTKLSAKILEQRIMDLMPAAILLYVRTASPGMLEGMYSGITGRVVMSICLGIYLAAVLIAERILKRSER